MRRQPEQDSSNSNSCHLLLLLNRISTLIRVLSKRLARIRWTRLSCTTLRRARCKRRTTTMKRKTRKRRRPTSITTPTTAREVTETEILFPGVRETWTMPRRVKLRMCSGNTPQMMTRRSRIKRPTRICSLMTSAGRGAASEVRAWASLSRRKTATISNQTYLERPKISKMRRVKKTLMTEQLRTE